MMAKLGQIGAILTLGILVTGCSSIENHRGYVMDEALVQSVQPGLDNQLSVEQTLGRPTFTSEFGNPVWYYVSSRTEQAPFTTPRIAQQRVLAVAFDAQGNVISADESGMDQVVRINPESDETPTLGRERSFLEDLFGNIGQVGAMGAGGGAGGPGGGM